MTGSSSVIAEEHVNPSTSCTTGLPRLRHQQDKFRLSDIKWSSFKHEYLGDKLHSPALVLTYIAPNPFFEALSLTRMHILLIHVLG